MEFVAPVIVIWTAYQHQQEHMVNFKSLQSSGAIIIIHLDSLRNLTEEQSISDCILGLGANTTYYHHYCIFLPLERFPIQKSSINHSLSCSTATLWLYSQLDP